MKIPLQFILLTFTTVTHTDALIDLLDLSRCGGKEKYLECHVEADCLYGDKKRESPMYLRRYFEEYHGERDISQCKTVIVVSASAPKKKPKSDSYLHTVHVEHDVRRFTASGWIDPAHFSIGVRFIVGQKIVMLSEDDGFTDDDDWVYGKRQLADLGQFPVFNGTFNQTTNNGKISFSLKAQAYDSWRRSHYVIPYRPRQPLSPYIHKAVEESEQKASTHEPTEIIEYAADVKPQKQQASSSNVTTGATEKPATAGLPTATIVISVVGAIISSAALGGVGYTWVKRKRRNAAKVKTERTQETETLIPYPGAEERPAPAPQQ